MKAWIVYWSAGPKNINKKTHGCTAVISVDLVSAASKFISKFPNREISSINSEADEVLVVGDPV